MNSTRAETRDPILIIAGENSGDLHGANLVRELLTLRPGLRFFGIGGARLTEAGVESLYTLDQMNVSGFWEVAKRYRFLRNVFRTIVDRARKELPVLAILVDYPGFNLRLARKLSALNIPVVYYIAPQVWAWKEGRVRQIRKYIKDLVVVFPFEVDYFAGHGIKAHFFGHPLIDQLHNILPVQGRTEPSHPPTIAFLPGSRPQEIERHMPLFIQTMQLLGSRSYRFIVPRASSLSQECLSNFQEQFPFEICDGPRDALLIADAALVKAGTSTLETGLFLVPFAVMYKTSIVTYGIARAAIKIPWIAMVNILSQREIVREFVQAEATPTRMAQEIQELLADNDYRSTMLHHLEKMRTDLGTPGAAERTAGFIIEKYLS